MSSDPHQAPIVLVHGLFGFDQLKLSRSDYFRSIPQALRAAGHEVPTVPKLNLAGRIRDRAAELREYLSTNPEVAGKSVHLIAHSMGGLDARWMLSETPALAARVLSLTTIGTPHHGSPIADFVVAGGQPVLATILEHLRLDIHGIGDLTTSACRKFNDSVKDPIGVRCFSVAGRFNPPTMLKAPLGLLGPFQRLIFKTEQDNDGLVSVKSARFGANAVRWDYLGEWEANHFRLINWGENFVPTPAELGDDSIIEKYKTLVATVTAKCLE